MERRLYDHPDSAKRRSYLVGFEICKRYNLKPEPLIESQMMAMDKLYYKYQDEREEHHNLVCLKGDREAIVDCECPVELDALYAWEDYALDKMESSMDWKLALTVVLLTLTLR